MPKGIPKRKLKRTPKKDDSPEENPPDKNTLEDLDAQRERIKRAIIPHKDAPEDDDGDLDLDEELEDGEKSDEKDMSGPHRRKLMAPLVKQYISGARDMLKNRPLANAEQYRRFGEGLDKALDSGLGMLDILLRKWLGDIPYGEEAIFAANAATIWYGGQYLDERLKTDAPPGSGGDGKNDTPAAPSGPQDH